MPLQAIDVSAGKRGRGMDRLALAPPPPDVAGDAIMRATPSGGQRPTALKRLAVAARGGAWCERGALGRGGTE